MNINVPQNELEAFCLRWKVVQLALFGSVLRDDFGPGSDVDILVSFTPEAEWSFFDLSDMEDDLTRIFKRKVDLVPRKGIEHSRNPIRKQNILGSAKVIYDSAA